MNIRLTLISFLTFFLFGFPVLLKIIKIPVRPNGKREVNKIELRFKEVSKLGKESSNIHEDSLQQLIYLNN